MTDHMTFPAYVMKTMYVPGDNEKHLLENVLTNLWEMTADDRDLCAHVWLMVYDPAAGCWEAAWIQKTEDQWEAWLRERDPQLDEVIEATIKSLEAEANGGYDDD